LETKGFNLTKLPFSADHVYQFYYNESMTRADPKRTEIMRSPHAFAFPQVHIAHICPLKKMQLDKIGTVIGQPIEDHYRSGARVLAV